MVLTCAEQTTYRHSHVGSAGSPTVIVSGGEGKSFGIVINGTPNNKYLRGIPNETELARMGLRLKYNGPLKEEFKQLKFHQSDGTDLRSSIYKTIVFEKVK